VYREHACIRTLHVLYEKLLTTAAADPASIPKLQQKGGVNATEVAEALPYKDSLGQPVFCQLLSDAEVRGQQSCLICKALVKLDSMREHVGSHVLQEHVSSDVCGFCGGTSCTPYLTAKEQPGQRKAALAMPSSLQHLSRRIGAVKQCAIVVSRVH